MCVDSTAKPVQTSRAMSARPRTDHPLHRAVVVGAEDDVGVEAGRAEVRLEQLPRPADTEADERELADLLERGRRPPGRERRAGLDEQHVRVVEEVQPLERALPQPEVGEREVEIAALDEAHELLVGVHLRDPQLDARPRGAEAAHQRRQHALADRLVRADPERPRLARGQCCEVRLRGLEPGHDRLRVAQQELTGLGEGHRSRPTRAVEQALADDPLEGRDLLADGGLRVAETLRRAAERARLRNRLERSEMPQLDAEPPIRFHDRHQTIPALA